MIQRDRGGSGAGRGLGVRPRGRLGLGLGIGEYPADGSADPDAGLQLGGRAVVDADALGVIANTRISGDLVLRSPFRRPNLVRSSVFPPRSRSDEPGSGPPAVGAVGEPPAVGGRPNLVQVLEPARSTEPGSGSPAGSGPPARSYGVYSSVVDR